MAISFSLQTKEEIARIKGRRSCCCKAEFSAFLCLGNLVEQESDDEIILTTPYAFIARKVFTLAKEVTGLPVNIAKGHRSRSGRRSYKIIISSSKENLKDLLAGCSKTPARQCCCAAYIRGVFLVNGSVSKPSGTHHLEYVFNNETAARKVQAVMERYELQPRLSRRQKGYILYLKDSEQIVRNLSLMGAYNAVLAYENALIYKDVRNQVNRLVNCDTANLSKTVETGLRQAENIRYLVFTLGWEGLSPGLRDIAALRLKYPEASLKELGEMLVPPIGKSGVNHRLRRLESLARQVMVQRGEY